MLAFDHPIPHIADGFTDHADLARQYLLADQLVLALDDFGNPNFSLMRHSPNVAGSGGLLQAKFQLGRHDEATPVERPHAIRTRVIMRSSTVDAAQLREWKNAIITSQNSFGLAIFMDQTEVEIMHQLALSDGALVQVDAECDYVVMRDGHPWEIRADMVRLINGLKSILGAGIHSQDAIIAAFRGLQDGLVTFISLAGAAQHLTDDVWIEAALQITRRVFIPSREGWALNEEIFNQILVLRLDRPRSEIHTKRLQWQFSDTPELTADDTAILRHFPAVRAIRPFEKIAITALNQIPLDGRSALQLRADLTFTSRTGTPTHDTITFLPEQSVLATKEAVFPALVHPFELTSKVQVVLRPSLGVGFPVFWPKDATHLGAEDPLSLDLTAERLDVQIRQFFAEPEVFVLCDSVDVTCSVPEYSNTYRLDPASPEIWVVLPDRAAFVTVNVMANLEDESQPLDVIPNESGNAQISVSNFIPMQPDQMVFEITDSAPFAIIDFFVDQHLIPNQTKTLRRGETIQFEHWGASIFDAPAYSFQASVVRLDASGETLPIDTGELTQTLPNTIISIT